MIWVIITISILQMRKIEDLQDREMYQKTNCLVNSGDVTEAQAVELQIPHTYFANFPSLLKLMKKMTSRSRTRW